MNDAFCWEALGKVFLHRRETLPRNYEMKLSSPSELKCKSGKPDTKAFHCFIYLTHRTLLKHILLKYTSLKFSVSGYICHKELKCLIFPQKEGVDPRAILDQVFWRNSRMFGNQFSLNPTRPRKQTINIESHTHPQMFQFTVLKRWRSDKYINFQFVAFLKNSFWKYVLTNIFSFGQIWPS